MIPLSERVQQALDAGFTNADLARAAGVSSGAVSQWLTTTKKLAADSVIGLVALTGWRMEWWAKGIGPRENSSLPQKGVAHELSQAVAKVPPERIRLSWRDLMERADSLPEHFSLEVLDDAMAPLLSRGDIAHFSRDKKPRPARPVLVADRDGHAYIRNYEERRGDHFRAVALAAGFQPLDSVDDGLRVAAVLTGWD